MNEFSFESFYLSRTYGDAVIIFDMMGFIHKFGDRKHIELNVGGRIHLYLAKFRHFVDQLKNAGATLVFICDGHLRTDRLVTWCKRRTIEFEKTYQMVTVDRELMSTYSLGCKTICSSLFKIIEDEQLGTIIISTHSECDAIVANYANTHNALAVVGNDSDALIYAGNFHWWQSNSLDMVDCTVRSFDRSLLWHHLRLNHDQMKYFATIVGNDYSLKMVPPLRWQPMRDFQRIANVCRSLTANNDPNNKIASYIRGDRSVSENDLKCIKSSIDSYRIDVKQPAITDRMERFYQHNVLLYALRNQAVLQIDANFLDFHRRRTNINHKTFIDSIVDVCGRLAGILLLDNRTAIVQICTKYTMDEVYTLKKHAPEFPNGLRFFFTFIDSINTMAIHKLFISFVYRILRL